MPLTYLWGISVAVCAAAAAVAVWVYCALARRHQMTRVQFALYLANQVLARAWWGLRVTGRMPRGARERGFLLAANHCGSGDPLLLQAAFAVPIRWMIAREYSNAPVLSTLLRIIGIVPVTRDAVDRSAAKQAITQLRDGHWIGLFPEGGINNTAELLLPSRAGIALIARRAGVPIVPCFISGSPYRGTIFSSFMMPARVRIRIGRPILPTRDGEHTETRDERGEAMENGAGQTIDSDETTTLRILRAIAELAGRPDYEPRILSRKERINEPRMNWV